MILVEVKIITENDTQYKVETYDNGTVVKTKYIDPKDLPDIDSPTEPEPDVSQDEINAEILLNQCEILSNQEAQDEVLAEILLNGVN